MYEKNGKEFYTIKTENGNIYYLIIDRLREDDNVYFLNAVTETDLLALAKKSGTPINTVTDSDNDNSQQQSSFSEPETSPKQNPNQNDITGTIIFAAIAVILAGIIGFYIKIIQSKKYGKNDDMNLMNMMMTAMILLPRMKIPSTSRENLNRNYGTSIFVPFTIVNIVS